MKCTAINSSFINCFEPMIIPTNNNFHRNHHSVPNDSFGKFTMHSRIGMA